MIRYLLLTLAAALSGCSTPAERPAPAAAQGIAHAQQCMNKIADDAVNQARPSPKDHYLEEFRFTRLEWKKPVSLLMPPHS